MCAASNRRGLPGRVGPIRSWTVCPSKRVPWFNRVSGFGGLWVWGLGVRRVPCFGFFFFFFGGGVQGFGVRRVPRCRLLGFWP